MGIEDNGITIFLSLVLTLLYHPVCLHVLAHPIPDTFPIGSSPSPPTDAIMNRALTALYPVSQENLY